MKRAAIGNHLATQFNGAGGTADRICGGSGDRGATGSHLSYCSGADAATLFANKPLVLSRQSFGIRVLWLYHAETCASCQNCEH